MNVFNKLSINLQQIVLDKIFQNQKKIYKNIISNINSLKGKHLYGISHPNYDLINSKNIKYCVHCNNKSYIKTTSDIPYYHTTMYKKNAYKTKKSFYKYYMKRYLERTVKNFRCSWEFNNICYSCYHSISNKSVKLFI